MVQCSFKVLGFCEILSLCTTNNVLLFGRLDFRTKKLGGLEFSASEMLRETFWRVFYKFLMSQIFSVLHKIRYTRAVEVRIGVYCRVRFSYVTSDNNLFNPKETAVGQGACVRAY